LKKDLALLLSAAMVLGTFAPVSAAEADVSEEIIAQEEAALEEEVVVGDVAEEVVDGEETVGEEDIVGATDPTDLSTIYNKKGTIIFNASDLVDKSSVTEVGSIDATEWKRDDVNLGLTEGFTISAKSKISVDGSTKSLNIGDNKLTFTKRLKTEGKSTFSDTKQDRVISFTTTAASNIIIICANDSKNDERYMCFYKDGAAESNLIEKKLLNEKGVITYSDHENKSAGTYYVTADGNGISIYAIIVEPVDSSSGGDSATITLGDDEDTDIDEILSSVYEKKEELSNGLSVAADGSVSVEDEIATINETYFADSLYSVTAIMDGTTELADEYSFVSTDASKTFTAVVSQLAAADQVDLSKKDDAVTLSWYAKDKEVKDWNYFSAYSKTAGYVAPKTITVGDGKYYSKGIYKNGLVANGGGWIAASANDSLYVPVPGIVGMADLTITGYGDYDGYITVGDETFDVKQYGTEAVEPITVAAVKDENKYDSYYIPVTVNSDGKYLGTVDVKYYTHGFALSGENVVFEVADKEATVAGYGEKVIVAPAEGYTINGEALVADNAAIDFTAEGDGKYSFIMGAAAVELDVTAELVSYNVTKDRSIKSISKNDVEVESAHVGDELVITPQDAAEHYAISEVYYTKENDDTKYLITVNKTTGKYTMSMPASDIVVSAEYVKLDEKYTVSLNFVDDLGNKIAEKYSFEADYGANVADLLAAMAESETDKKNVKPDIYGYWFEKYDVEASVTVPVGGITVDAVYGRNEYGFWLTDGLTTETAMYTMEGEGSGARKFNDNGWKAKFGDTIKIYPKEGYVFDTAQSGTYSYQPNGGDWVTKKFDEEGEVSAEVISFVVEGTNHGWDNNVWIPTKKGEYTISVNLIDKTGASIGDAVNVQAEYESVIVNALKEVVLPDITGYVAPSSVVFYTDKGVTALANGATVPADNVNVYVVYDYKEYTITKSGDNADTFTVSKTSGIKGTEFTVAPAQGYRLLSVMASNATVKTDAESTFVVKGTGDVVVTAGTEETAVAVQVVKDDAQITITGTIPAKMEEDDVITFNVGTKAGYNTPVVSVTGASMSKGSTKKGDGTYENKGKTDEIVVYAPTGNVTITITAKADAASGTVIEEDETYLDTNDMDLHKIGNYSAGKAGYLLTDYDSSSSTKTIDASVLINGAKSAVNKFTLKGKTMVADQVETVTAESGSTFVRRINMGGGDRTITFDVPADSVVTVIGRASGTSSTRGYKFSVGGTLIDEVTFDNSAELPLKTTVHEVSTAGTAEIKSVNNIDIFYIGISAKPPVTYAVTVITDEGIDSVKYEDGNDIKELNGANLEAGSYIVRIETVEGKVIDKAEGLTPIKDSEKYELTITDKAVTVNVTSKDAEVPPVEEEYDIVLPTGLVLITPESGKAKAGEKITVKADDLDGAVIKGVKVRDKDGNSVEVTDNGDGTYSFSMVEGGLSKIALETEPVLPPTPEEYGEEDKDFRDPVTYDPVLTEKTVKTVSSNYEKMAKLSVKGGAETDVVVKGAFDDTGLLIQHYKGGKVKLVTVSECKVSQNSASSNTVVTVNAKTKVCLPASYANTMSDAPRSTLGHSSKLAALKVNKKGIVKPKAYAGCAIYEAIFTNAAGSTITLRVVSLGFDTSLKKMAVSPSQNLIVRPTMLYGSRDTLIAQGSGLLNGVWTIGKNIVLMPGQTVSDPKTGAKVTLNANGTLKVTNLANKGNLKIAYSLNGRTYKTSIKSQNTKPSGIENYYKALGLLY